MGLMSLLAFVIDFHWFGSNVTNSNFSYYGFDYANGFMPAGILGSLAAFINSSIFSGIYSYSGIFTLNEIVLTLSFAIRIIVFAMILREAGEKHFTLMTWLLFFYAVFSFTMFINSPTYGSPESYMEIVVILCMLILLKKKGLFLIIPLCILGELIHPIFIISRFPLIAVLFLIILSEKKSTAYRGLIFGLSFVSVFITAFISQKAFDALGDDFIDTILLCGKTISGRKKYAEEDAQRVLESMNITGGYHLFDPACMKQLVCLALVFIPYIIILFMMIRVWIKNKRTAVVICLILGALPMTLVIMKGAPGIFSYDICTYVIAVLMGLVLSDDEGTLSAFYEAGQKIRAFVPIPQALIMYPLLFLPFKADEVSNIITKILSQLGMVLN